MNTVQQIKSKLSIIDVVGDYVQLKKYGKNWKGLCPFHDDTHPSLIANEETGLVWCFVCSSGGDMFNFVQMIERCSFIEALNILGKKADVDINKYIPTSEADKKMKSVIDALNCASSKYIYDLKSTEAALSYVKKRELHDETIDLYKVGYADKEEKSMCNFLIDNGFSEETIIESGLGIKYGNKIIDKFIDRIMFPFEIYSGSIIGYIGRTLGDEMPKYVNTSNGGAFKKGDLLFGMAHARRSVSQKKEVYLVEGQFDVLSCRDSGIKNVVATSGTAFSNVQAMQIKRYSHAINFAYDSDKAGIEATIRAIKIAAYCGLICNVVVLPDGKDPDDLMRDKTINSIFEKKIDAVDFLYDYYSKIYNIDNAKDKKDILDNVFDFISKISSTVYKDHCIQRLSDLSGIKKYVLENDYTKEYKPIQKAEVYKEKIGFDSIEIFVGTIVSFPKLMDIAKKNLIEELLPESVSRDIYMLIKNNNVYSKKKILDMINKYIEGHHDKWSLISVYTTNLYDKLDDKMLESEFTKQIKIINKEIFKIKYNFLKKIKASSQEINSLLKLSKKIK